MKLQLDIWSKDYRGGNEGIRGEAFLALLDLCFSHADHFSISDQSPKEWKTVPCAVQDMLAPYLIKTLETPVWLGYFHTEPPLRIFIYRANEETKRIFADSYSDLFLYSQKKVPKKRVEQIGKDFVHLQRPENLCFFKNRRVFLGTVSHELMCMADCPDEAFETELRSIAPFSVWTPPDYENIPAWRIPKEMIPPAEPLDGWEVHL